MDTSYLGWNTSFPAVAICELDSPDKIDSAASELFGDDRNMNLDFYLKDIVFFEGTCFTCIEHCGRTINCTNDFQSLIRTVRSSCEDLMSNCSWNGIPFDCCEAFVPLDTEVGYCYIINSLQTLSDKTSSTPNLVSNADTGPGNMEFYLYESSKVYIQSTEDVPFANHPQEEKVIVPWGYAFAMNFQMVEIVNDVGLINLSPGQRNCWFHDEFPLSAYPKYSYSACVVSCRASVQQQLCNCTNHLLPEILGAKSCGVEGLKCLSLNSDKLKSLRGNAGHDDGIFCDCRSSCTEPEFQILSTDLQRLEDSDGSKVSLILESIPKRRFKRNIVRSNLDLVVSIGGAVGLFLGGSLLSIGELYYFLLLRKSKSTINQPTTSFTRSVNLNSFIYPRNVLMP